ncbi:MAG: MFS transporter [Anaerolineae bacterium]|nr:MFS transporter [Anaerolineae bacterium]
MRAFTLVWFGQFISLTGSAMTQFALTIWAYQLTGEATALALAAFFNFAPAVLLSPIAGALVDRWNRKLVMMFSDLGAGISTIALFLLYITGNMQIWHIYAAGFFAGLFQSFQFPAYSASISLMLPKAQYGRAQGMLALAEAGSGILAPVFAGALLATIGVGGVMLIDIVTFTFAVGALTIIYVPQPPQRPPHEAPTSLWQDIMLGFRYIGERRSLLGLLLIFLAANFSFNLGNTLLAPMILARSGNDEFELAAVQSLGAVGGVLGGIILTVWGGPKRRIHGVLVGLILEGGIRVVLLAVGRTVLAWSAANFVGLFVGTILNASSQAIWQSKVAPEVQGRVFATRRLIAQITAPLAMLLAGPLADRVFEPAMQPNGALVGVFGALVGVGAGAGIAVMILLTSAAEAAIGVVGYATPAVRHIETILPDHQEHTAIVTPAN